MRTLDMRFPIQNVGPLPLVRPRSTYSLLLNLSPGHPIFQPVLLVLVKPTQIGQA